MATNAPGFAPLNAGLRADEPWRTADRPCRRLIRRGRVGTFFGNGHLPGYTIARTASIACSPGASRLVPYVGLQGGVRSCMDLRNTNDDRARPDAAGAIAS